MTESQKSEFLYLACTRTYLALLNHPDDKWRLQNQDVYCRLRDAIAVARGWTPKETQEWYEHIATTFRL